MLSDGVKSLSPSASLRQSQAKPWTSWLPVPREMKLHRLASIAVTWKIDLKQIQDFIEESLNCQLFGSRTRLS